MGKRGGASRVGVVGVVGERIGLRLGREMENADADAECGERRLRWSTAGLDHRAQEERRRLGD